MGKFLIGLIMGIIVGSGGLWFLQQKQAVMPEKIQEQTAKATGNARKRIDAKLEVLELQASKIMREMSEKGSVVRRKASALGERVSDAAADAQITALIKAKLAADPDLSAWVISVNTTEGVVTLSGKVAEPELVGKAMLLALETNGVREVISTLQVRKQ